MSPAAKRQISDTLALATTPPVHIPQLGFGTYLSPPTRTLASCLAALEAGYRHIDTAQYYENEAEVGQALRQSGLARDEVFVTTKILKVAASADEDYAACLESVERIGGPGDGAYVDLFLIHSPRGGPKKRREMWLALERLYEEGKARAIGLSNFGIGQIEELKGVGKVWPPHVNQIEVSAAGLLCSCDVAHLSARPGADTGVRPSCTLGTNRKKSSRIARRTGSSYRPTVPSSGTRKPTTKTLCR